MSEVQEEQVQSPAYERLLALLDQQGITYRLLHHEPEGRTEVISQIRNNVLSQAAKAMVIMVKIGKKERQYYLAVVPGDCRVALEHVKRLCNGTHAMFAPEAIAQELTNCVMGAVPPFSFHPQLQLVVDPMLLEHDEIVFNAGRLDTSLFISKQDYIKAAHPRLESIATR